MIGLSLTAYGICFAIVQGTMVGPCIKKFGERNTVFIGFVFEMMALLAIAIVWNGWLLIALTPLASLGVISTPAIQAMMSKRIDDKSQGALQGVLGSTNAIAMIVTPLLMTWLFSIFSDRNGAVYFPGAPFLAATFLILICVVLFFKIRHPSGS